MPPKTVAPAKSTPAKDKKPATAAPKKPEPQAPAQKGSPEVNKWVIRALEMGVDKLREEYRGLAKYVHPQMTLVAFTENHPLGRNRYQDVPCQDQCRVALKIPNFAVEYIHANYVSTPQAEKRFICTQGPLDSTVPEFWVMVLQEGVTIIVMLCNVVENGKAKCAQYWPEKEGDSMKLDGCNIEVTHVKSGFLQSEPSVRRTTIRVRWPGGEREITHYQWMDWPDRGVPPTRLTAMELLSCVRGAKQPIVVHCSAGIGRTGTIVAIEYILERMQAQQECAAMNELLKMLRNQRAYSIQNDLQYLYIHRVMLSYFMDKHSEKYGSLLKQGDYQAKYDKFLADYQTATGQA